MAEFMEVVRQYRRMCDVSTCDVCILKRLNNKAGKACYEEIINNPESFETRVMQWASEHPEPKYPTWQEWQRETFPEGVRPICLLNFMGREACTEFECCAECHASAIPANIAEKLGVKPIEGRK